MKRLFALIFCLCLFVSGCATIPTKSVGELIEEKMNSWLGAHQSEVIAEFGAPTRTAPDGKGGTILLYENNLDLGQTEGRIYTDAWGNVSYTAPRDKSVIFVKQFYVDENGYVYSWKTGGK